MTETTAHFPPKMRVLFDKHRYKVFHGGRGSGKSWAFARALLIQAAAEPLRVLCCREVQRSIKQSVHQLLKDQIQELGFGYLYDVTETAIRCKNGSEFYFAGLASHTAESIKSYEGIDRVWIEEGATVSKKSLDILIPTIRKPKSEIWISFNPDLETDEIYQRFVVQPPDDCVVVQVNFNDNPWLPDVLDKERIHCQVHRPKEYDWIWLGKARVVAEGAIYADEFQQLVEEHRITRVSHDPVLKTHVVMDLGWADSMSLIMVQRSGSELRIIDYIEESYKTLDYYSDQLKQRPYNWGTVFMPHDAVARDFKTGKSAAELMTQLGWTISVVPMGEVEGGIRVARLAFPRCWFDKEKAARLLECLKRYRRSINATTGQPQGPLHDDASHGADAFRYMCVSADQMRNDNIKRRKDYDSGQTGSWMGA
jgi:phage terminase large subunit